MTEKRFEIQYDGYRYFVVVDIENERGIARMDTMPDAKGFLEMYEMFIEENEQIKDTIREAYNTERTALGKSVLKQLKEALEL